MTTPVLSPVARATQKIADAVAIVPGLRVTTKVVTSVTPPIVVISPPKLATLGYCQLLTAQWSVCLVVTLNEYAIDALMASVEKIVHAVERFTPGVATLLGPTRYPNSGGLLPAYLVTVQMEIPA